MADFVRCFQSTSLQLFFAYALMSAIYQRKALDGCNIQCDSLRDLSLLLKNDALPSVLTLNLTSTGDL